MKRIIKSLVIIAVVTTAVFLTGCTSDEDDVSKFIGTWKDTASTNDRITYNADGTGHGYVERSGKNYTVDFNWKVEDGVLYRWTSSVEATLSYEFSDSNNRLTITDHSNSETSTFVRV